MYMLVGARNVYRDVIYTIYNTLNKQIDEVNGRSLRELLQDYMFSNVELQDGEVVGIHCNLNDYLAYQKYKVHTLLRKVEDRLLLIDNYGNRIVLSEKEYVERAGKDIICLNIFKVGSRYEYPAKIKVTERAETRKRPLRSSMKLEVQTAYVGRLLRNSESDEDELDWLSEGENLESSFVLMCNRVYSSYFGREVSVRRLYEWYRASDEVYLDSLAVNCSVTLLNGLGSGIELSESLRENILTSFDTDDVLGMMQIYDTNGRFFILPLSLDGGTMEELEKLLNNS